ncbi:hypothetical protein [Psychroserpens sp. SPM9]|uniref:hypothetical protein n=1 Tax=Psychroserpens sp. SPM9 TaxID=2975598 RepID=UPI0021A48805|nr:hypothetical protein [Psychroserpens sp. SPM9]MDG5492660.1 hypothetical protein [Psychroserpens sp. SPM9]
METISNYSKYVPYFYFLTVIAYWFTDLNKSFGLTAYPILLFGIPFLWQLIKPNRKLNFTLGITFVCLSSYMILAYLSDILNIVSLSDQVKQWLLFSGLFIVGNFVMALWMIRNSLNRKF